MKKIFLSFIPVIVCGMILILLNHCGGSSTSSSSSSGTLGPTLTSDDFSSVTPCSDRDTNLDDTTFIAVFTNATSFFNPLPTFTGDVEVMCGLQGSAWDPASIGICLEESFLTTLQQNFDFAKAQSDAGAGSLSICSTGFTFTNLDYGLMLAGNFRNDYCVENGGNAYLVRVKATITGTDAGKTYASLGLTNGESDLELWNEDGTTQFTTVTEAKQALIDQLNAGNTSATFSIRSNSGASNHITVAFEVLCVKKLTGSCSDNITPTCTAI